MKFEELETDRLRLRKITMEEFDYIYQNYSDTQLIEFLGLKSPEELAIEKKKYKGGYTIFNKKILFFQLLEKESRHNIGWCGYHTWYIDHDRAEIGYGMTQDEFKGKGLMTEAIIPILEYGFKKMNLNRVEAFISPNNIPSLKLIDKMNFVKEGHLKQHYRNNDVIEDSLVFALLQEDFQFL